MAAAAACAGLLKATAPTASAQAPQPAEPLNRLTPEEQAAGWHLLFDGDSLDGWTTSGNLDAWRVEDGAIRCVPNNGWWLRTEDQHRDFELFVDFKLAPGANSGLGLRGSATGDPAFTGMELQIFDSHGQEPSLNGCGAVYNAIAPRVQAVKPAGEWNTYRVLLEGDTLSAWLNGQPIHVDEKLDDRGIVHVPEDKNPMRSRVKSGYLSFQDHGDEVWFRNIKIRPIDMHPLDVPPAEGEPQWVDLFNGRDLTGWFSKGNATWSAEDGQIVGRDGGPGHLYSDGVYKDFELRAKVRINTAGNSGFYFRAKPPEGNPDHWPDGYEAQVDHRDPQNFTGCLYGRAWAKELVTRENEWFDYNVRCVGNEITLAINGRTMLETTQNAFAEGHVALQGHHKGSEVRWRDIQIRPLHGTAAKTTAAAPGKGTMIEPKSASAASFSELRVAPPSGKTDAADPASDATKETVDIFFCTHPTAYRHDVLDEARRIVQRLDEKHDWLKATVSDNVADMTPDLLADLDTVVFFTQGEPPMSEEQKSAFVNFCEGGGGFVGIHCGADTYANWEWYVRHVGGTFDGHPWNKEVVVAIEDAAHPAMKVWGDPAKFKIADEIYQFKSVGEDLHVLARLLVAGDPPLENNREYPLVWTRTTGQGRVFYTAFGHRPEVWRDQRFIDHLLAGIRWATNVEG